jgi:hypothetical protein
MGAACGQEFKAGETEEDATNNSATGFSEGGAELPSNVQPWCMYKVSSCGTCESSLGRPTPYDGWVSHAID